MVTLHNLCHCSIKNLKFARKDHFPLMTISGNKIANSDGSLGSTKICDNTNTVEKWPSPEEVVAQAKTVVGF